MKSSFDSWMLFAAALLGRLFFYLYLICIPLAGIVAVASPVIGIALLNWLWPAMGRWILPIDSIPIYVFLLLFSFWQLYTYPTGGRPISHYKKDFSNKISSNFISWFGTLKYFTRPYSLVADPGSYAITGPQIRQLIEPGKYQLQPGDILLRGYKNYLDGAFIQHTGGADGLSRFFSHSAIYAGQLTEADRALACTQLKIQTETGEWVKASEAAQQERRHDAEYFQTGTQMVIHSMAKGVHVEDILTFLRCDYVAVLRLPEQLSADPADRAPTATRGKVSANSEALLQSLQTKHALQRSEVVQAALRTALSEIGSGYDFLFEHVKDHHIYSCSELVYHCFQSVNALIGLKITEHRFLGFLFKRDTVAPADIYKAATQNPDANSLKLIWQNVGKAND